MKHEDRIILFATGVRFSRIVLDTLLDNKIKPVAIALPVYPPVPIEDLPGVKIERDSQSKQFADKVLTISIPVLYAPENLQDTLPEQLSAIRADYILLACWPYLLSSNIIELASKAALNIHPSLLPKYRGASPIAEQLTQGEVNLGVTLHLLSEHFDQGDILLQEKLNFSGAPPAKEELEIEAAKTGARLFIGAMKDYASPGWSPVKQRKLPDTHF
ncbi:MAG: formyltransferase family protein [Gammaproteobacteria bacterium]